MSKNGILKTAGDFLATLFGFDSERIKNNDSMQSVGDSINDISRTIGGSAVFQTKKEKEEAERKAQEQMQRSIHETADTMSEINRTLHEISQMLDKKNNQRSR